MTHDPDDKYTVGYRRPPLHSRFRKGQSGNPKGRPKGAPNLDTLLTRILNEKVVVTTGGGRRLISKLEVLITQMVNKAAAGDLRAAQQVLAVWQTVTDPRGAEVETLPSMDETDHQIIAGLRRRLVKSDPSKDEDAGSEPE